MFPWGYEQVKGMGYPDGNLMGTMENGVFGEGVVGQLRIL